MFSSSSFFILQVVWRLKCSLYCFHLRFHSSSILLVLFVCASSTICHPTPELLKVWDMTASGHDCFRSFGSHPTEQVLSDLHFLFFGAHIILIGDLNICFVHANEMSPRNSSHRRPTKGKAWTRIGKWEESYLMNGVPFERERSASGGVPRCGQNTPVAVCC